MADLLTFFDAPLADAEALRLELYRCGYLIHPRALGPEAAPEGAALASSLDLDGDLEAMVAAMNDPTRPPPMLWSGVPLPPPAKSLEDTPWCLAISVGGTNTYYFFLRIEDHEVVGLAPDGRVLRGAELARARETCRVNTPPTEGVPCAGGQDMIDQILDALADGYLRELDAAREACQDIILSWGYAFEVDRTGAAPLGGLRARSTIMTKEQESFTEGLWHQDLGELFASGLARRLDGWRRPVTVANDGVMALHYFLDPGRRARFHRIGIFINGTGSNLCLAEPFAVRAEGYVTREGEEPYQPLSIHDLRYRPGKRDEELIEFFVNYETGRLPMGSTLLEALGDQADADIETNTLSGSNGLPQQFRELIERRVDPLESGDTPLYERLVAHAAEELDQDDRVPSPLVSGLADGSSSVEEAFPGLELDRATRQRIEVAAAAVMSRSAFHVALILAAATRRSGFGRGARSSDASASLQGEARADLLAVEGSVWKTRGYCELVHSYWNALSGDSLRVVFDHAPGYSASALGPVHFARLQGIEVS